MNNWKLTFDNDDSPAGNNLRSIFIKATFEDNVMDRILDVDGFFKVIENEGMQPMFTCECGTFWCTGYYVDVTHSAKGIIIKNGYKADPQRNEDPLIYKFEYEINWEDLYLMAREVIGEIKALSKKYPDNHICTGVYGVDLLPNINRYEEIIKELRKLHSGDGEKELQM